MTTTPCPTCRHYVLHLHELGATIAKLRVAAITHPGLHGRLMHHIEVGRRVKAKYSACRDEHRAAIREFATHLTCHAEGKAA